MAQINKGTRFFLAVPMLMQRGLARVRGARTDSTVTRDQEPLRALAAAAVAADEICFGILPKAEAEEEES
eukprot:COSAG06_NODE_7531_length_2469_cov_4.845992_2_plen_70_part_00